MTLQCGLISPLEKLKRLSILIGVKSFAKQDLPKEHRVLEPGAMTTQDYNPNRYVLCSVISGVGNDKLMI